MSTPARAAVALALLLIAAISWFVVGPRLRSPPPAGPVARTDGRPNVLVVLWDTVRADRMSLYGHPVPTTPKLEAFARDAAVYEHATSPATWTLPTHATLFTGRYPTTHGARAGYRWLDSHHVTLAELLLDGGYETFLFTSNLVAGPMTNLTQGFGVVHTTYPVKGRRRAPGADEAAADWATQHKLIQRDASTEISPAFAGRRDDHWPKSVYKDAAPVIVQGLLDWVDDRDAPERPWFAYLNLMEAHTPRIPSLSARQRVMDEATLELGLQTDLSLFAENEFMIGQRAYTEAELAAIRGVYDAALVDLDDATAVLLDGLRQRGILDDTLVILVSDHGEHLGEHGRFEHRWSVHQELLHVPLVVRYPARFPAGRHADRVSTADVFSTVLDVVGIEAPSGTQTRSLLATPTPHVFAQLLDPYASQLKNVREAYPGADIDYGGLLRTYCAAFGGDDKLVLASDGDADLFDLAADPGELQDRSGAQPERVTALSRALYDWEQALPLYDPEERGPMDKRSKAFRQDRQEARMLAQLGYVVDDEEATDEHHRDRCGPETRP